VRTLLRVRRAQARSLGARLRSRVVARVQVPLYTLLNGEQGLGPTFLVGVQYQVL